MAAKYSVPDDNSDGDGKKQKSRWRDETSANVDMEVTLHDVGYQTDRRWTVHVRQGHRDHPVAVYAAEHQNKGNFWRPPNLWQDAVDFVELPRPVRKRVASTFNRSIEEMTPEERMVHRDDGTGVGDLAGESSGTCSVCGGELYGDLADDQHEACKMGDVDV